MEFRKRDAWMALAIFVCGFLFWELAATPFLGAGVTIFAVVLCAVTFIYFKIEKIKLEKKSFIWLGVTLLFAAFFFISSESMIRPVNVLFMMGSYIYWAAVSSGTTLDKKLSRYLIGDGINQCIAVPFSNVPCSGAVVKRGLLGIRKKENTWKIAAGVAITLPLAAGVIYLLSSADVAFQTMLEEIAGIFYIENLWEYFLKLVLAVPVSFYLFSLLYGNVRKHKTEQITKENVDTVALNMAIAPSATIYTVTTIFNVIYLAFFASQLRYLFSAFSSVLPANYTYADYARQGFFQLCIVAAINLVVILAVNIFTKKRENRELAKGLKIEIGVLCSLSVLLTATAMSKMVMYVNIYGLTQLRTYTMFIMAVLFAALLIIGLRQIIRFNAPRMLIIVLLVVIFSASYGNIDGIIAKYNIDRHEAGTLTQLDYRALCALSDGAVPYIYRYYQSTDDLEIKKAIEKELLLPYRVDKDLYQEMRANFRNFNVQAYQADQIRQLLSQEK